MTKTKKRLSAQQLSFIEPPLILMLYFALIKHNF